MLLIKRLRRGMELEGLHYHLFVDPFSLLNKLLVKLVRELIQASQTGTGRRRERTI